MPLGYLEVQEFRSLGEPQQNLYPTERHNQNTLQNYKIISVQTKLYIEK